MTAVHCKHQKKIKSYLYATLRYINEFAQTSGPHTTLSDRGLPRGPSPGIPLSVSLSELPLMARQQMTTPAAARISLLL